MLKKRLGVFAAVLAIAAMAGPLEAQGRRGGGPGGGGGPDLLQQMKVLTEVLSLTEAQAPLVRAVLEKQQEKREGLFANGPRGDREAMRGSMMELQEETNTELKEILSEDQMKKFGEHQAQNRRRGRGGPGPRGSGGNA